MLIRKIGSGALGLLAALSLTTLGLMPAPAFADNLVIKDAVGTTQTTCAINVFGVLVPCHLMEGMKSGVPTATTLDPSDGGLTIHHLNLPPGASTAANQATALTSLSSIDGKVTGVATAAAQATGNTSLSSIDGKLTGQATAANQTTANTALATIVTNTGSAATAAGQTAGNTSLATIAANVATAAAQATGNAALATIATNSASAATAANQTTANTSLAAIAALYGASGKTPVTAALASASSSGAFTPIPNRPFNVNVAGTFVGAVQLERSFDGSTWNPITAAGVQLYAWTAAASEQVTEPEAGVQYRVRAVSYTSGTANIRISQ